MDRAALEPVAIRDQIHSELSAAHAIALAAATANRGLTDEESKKILAHQTRAQQLKDQIQPHPQGAPLHQSGMRGHGFDSPDGSPIALTNDQRCVDFLAARGVIEPDAQQIRPGEVLVGLLTGRRSHLNDAELRAVAAIGITGSSGGGFLIGPEVSAELIDLARAQSRIIQAGARVVPMEQSTLTYAKVNSGLTPAWVAEDQELTASEMVFGGVVLTPKSLGVLTKISLELLQDAPNAGEIVTQEIVKAVGLEFDRAALLEDGMQNKVKGLLYWNGINSRTLGSGNGGTPADFDFLLDAIADVWTANGSPNATIYSSRTARTLAGLKDQQDQPLQPPEDVKNLTRLVSNQIPNTLTVGASDDCSLAFTGAWSNLVIGLRMQIAIETSREASNSSGSAFTQRQLWLRGWMRADVAVLRASHFTVTRGIRP